EGEQLDGDQDRRDGKARRRRPSLQLRRLQVAILRAVEIGVRDAHAATLWPVSAQEGRTRPMNFSTTLSGGGKVCGFSAGKASARIFVRTTPGSRILTRSVL